MALIDEVLAKDPSLAAQRDQLETAIDLIDTLGSMLKGQIKLVGPHIKKVLPGIKVSPAETTAVTDSFAKWGASLDKFAKMWGLASTDDAVKLCVHVARNDPSQPLEKQGLTAFLLARLHPKDFDLLADAKA